MRNRFLITIFFLIMIISIFAESVRLSNLNNSFEVTDQTSGKISLQAIIGNFSTEDIIVNEKSYTKITADELINTFEKDNPSLPKISKSIIISNNRDVKYKIISTDYQEFSYDIISSKGLISRQISPDDIPYEFSEVYSKDAFYPNTIIELGEPYIMRDFRGIVINVYPFQYNPVSKVLRVYTEINIEIIEEGISKTNVLSKSNKKIVSSFDNLYSNHFINYKEKKDRYADMDETGRLIIISYNDFADEIQPYVDWKRQKGIPTDLYLMSEVGASYLDVQSFIYNQYNSSEGLTYVLLVGDNAQIPTPTSGGGGSDPTYALLTGSDSYPDIFIGRFSAENGEQVTIQVNKSIYYEKDIDSSASWLEKAMGVASNQGPGDDNEYDNVHMDNIRDLLLTYNYTSVDQIYDPSASASDVTSALNSGRGLINYVGHGSTTSWSTTGFSNTHINALTNDNKLPVIFSVACVNGNFTNSTCFGETWLRASNNTTGQPTGAISIYASSINQSWDPPMQAEDHFAELIINETKSTIGALYYSSSCSMIDEYGSGGESMYKTWHIFGDPSIQIRTKAPDEISVNAPAELPAGSTSLEVTTNTSGALISLYNGSDILASSYADNSGNTTLNFDPIELGDYYITVSGFNLQTEILDLQVVPADGPYITLNSYNIGTNNTLNYNNNGDIDFSIENIGTETATDLTATISTISSFISITENSANIGNLANGSSVVLGDQFSFDINPLVIDEEDLTIDLTITDGRAQWNFTLDFQINAPILEIESYDITEITGNGNGLVDPDEEIEIVATLRNNGHCISDQISVILQPEDYISFTQTQYSINPLTVGNTEQFTISASVSPDAPVSTQIDINCSITDNSGYQTTSDEINFDVGKPEVAILNFDPTTLSAPFITDRLDYHGIPYEIFTEMPESISSYNYLFITLGIYSNNYQLTSDDAAKLVDFTTNGGYIYMEGGDCWCFDSQNDVYNEIFFVSESTDGLSDCSGAVGQTGTIAAGMNFTGYTGENSYIDRINPIEPASAFLKNINPEYNIGISYDGNDYKTIAMSIELGGLSDGDSPSSKNNLLDKIFEFFELITIENNIAFGDVSGNGQVMAQDAAFVLQYSVGLDPIPEIDPYPWETNLLLAADVSGDGNILGFDASLILQFALGMITEFPAASNRYFNEEVNLDVDINNNIITISTDNPLSLYGLNINLPDSCYITSIYNIPENFNSSSSANKNKLSLATSKPEDSFSLSFEINNLESNSPIEIFANDTRYEYNSNNTFVPPVTNQFINIYPNPMSFSKTRGNGLYIKFNVVEKEARVNIDLYNVKGQKVDTVTNDYYTGGEHLINWNFSTSKNKVSSGIYFIKLRINQDVEIRKVMMIK